MNAIVRFGWVSDKRLSLREGGNWGMPPVAMEEADKEGAELIRAWIENRPPSK